MAKRNNSKNSSSKDQEAGRQQADEQQIDRAGVGCFAGKPERSMRPVVHAARPRQRGAGGRTSVVDGQPGKAALARRSCIARSIGIRDDLVVAVDPAKVVELALLVGAQPVEIGLRAATCSRGAGRLRQVFRDPAEAGRRPDRRISRTKGVATRKTAMPSASAPIRRGSASDLS